MKINKLSDTSTLNEIDNSSLYFKLLKKFKFPTLHYEDRLYVNQVDNI